MNDHRDHEAELAGTVSRGGDAVSAESGALRDLLESTRVRDLFQAFSELTNIPVLITDVDGSALFSSREQRICALVHQARGQRGICAERERHLKDQPDSGMAFMASAGKHKLIDYIAPILIDGKRAAIVFAGHFLTERPEEQELRKQAVESGFDAGDYIAAFRDVPVADRERIQSVLDLFARITTLLMTLVVERERAMEGQARQAIILDAIPQAVFWKGADGKFLGCNAPFANVAGLPQPADIVGKSDYDLPWPRREAEAYRADDIAVIRSNRPRLHIEEYVQRADGRRILADTSKVPLVDAAGRPYGVLGIFEDITEHRRKEQALAESERKYRELVESANSIILRWRRDGRITFLNEFGQRFFGYVEGEIIGQNVIGTIVPEVESTGRDLDRLMEKIEADPRAFGQNVNENMKRNGERVWISWTNKVVLDERGEIRELLSIGSDMTEHLRAEEQVKSAYARVTRTLDDAILTIAKIEEMRDPYTAGHQQRVALLAVAIAGEMNLEPARIEQLRMAAIIHDIGKINVPTDILSKPGKLTSLELEMIMTHARAGYDIVRNMNFLPEVAQTILQHHERLDGSGYPDRLKGDAIRLEARILAVADVVEAMASHRPYRPARGLDAALAEIAKNSGTHYDPDVCNACRKLIAEKRFAFHYDESITGVALDVDLKRPINVRAKH